MEIFTKAKAVKLRSHLEKYLVADDDQETVRQSRNNSGKRARWFVELVHDKPNVIRLRSCHGKYLAATDIPFLLGMTGKKVLQTVPDKMDWKLQWEPIRDGFQIKFKTWCGKFLRGNGGTPPWRNSVTHDEPHTGGTQRWVLWDVEAVQVPESDSVMEYISSVSSFSSVSDEVLEALSDGVLGSGTQSPISVVSSLKSPRFSMVSTGSPKQTNSNKYGAAMDLFLNVKAVRLRSHHDKYLVAGEDEESVSQDRNGSSKNARWTVEFVLGFENIIRFKSIYNKYLTASNQPLLLGMTGRKVIQSLPKRLDSSVEWEPISAGNHVKLKTQYGNFLRANGGLPPWRNSVTHDIPHRTATQDWILWDVDIVEIEDKSPPAVPHADSLNLESTSPSAVSAQSSDSYVDSPHKSEGRTIYYHVVDDNGEVDDEAVEGYSFRFKGNNVAELTQKLMEETGHEDIVVCTRSPLNGKLYPLRLQLPPNNADMHVVVVVPLGSKVARNFAK
ncbi:pentatricopeptide repeat-containing protein [Hibiscus syriacus]|uniref:Pentatricopeptide repeat-containing protein n=1 Tax=Hibiscus syriacus TaxID=106335 RepID=A0A6A3BN65_HIBSY|nr:uncharacterized protein LOC120215239 [Hibiscus syriacus]XP_039068898.1 uncharacterized protein LOC120215239 [Hibiscus syriacus]KAE8716502.1 pentatricopeptide repeat-containing protein [Hibiscus syriacus]